MNSKIFDACRNSWHKMASHAMVRGVGLLAGGTILAQAVAFLATPLLTRFYTPQDFGVLAVYASILGILAVFNTLRYELALPLSRDEHETGALVALCLLVVVIMTLLAESVRRMCVGSFLAQFENVSVIIPYLWLLPVGVGLSGVYQTLSYLATRNKQFGAISATKVSQSLGMVAIQTGSGCAGVGALGLIVGHIAGQCFGIGTLARGTNIRSIMHSVTFRQVRNAAILHWKFPAFYAVSACISTLGNQAAPLFFASCFGVVVSGSFFLPTRVLSLPSMLVGAAVSQVLYPEMARRAREHENLSSLLYRTTSGLLFLGAPFFFFVAIWGSEIFVVCFGANWHDAGVYAQILAPWLLINFLSSPISTLCLVKGQQRVSFLISMMETFLRLSAIFLGWRYGSAITAVMLFSVVGAIVCAGYTAWIFYLGGGNWREWISSVRGFIVLLVLFALILLLVKMVLPTLLAFLVSMVVVVSLYLWTALKYNTIFHVVHG